MISKKMLENLNRQLNREYSSHYIYLAMSAYCRALGMDGAAHWMRVQATEEMGHAMKFFDYVEQQQARVTLAAIDQPADKFKSIQEAFDKTLAHERYITKSINELMDLAHQEKDYATQTFLQWFVTEQVEEEANAQTIVDRIKMIGDSTSGLLYLDKELGKRA
jgi:ferritin